MHHRPATRLGTHEVVNQPPPLAQDNAYAADPVIQDCVRRAGAAWAEPDLKRLGETVAGDAMRGLADQAERFAPSLQSFDRYGQRLDEVEYHPAYHQLMALAVEHGLPWLAWRQARLGAHAAHAALVYLFGQVEFGVCCPMAMTYAAVPVLRGEPELACHWQPRMLAERHDPRFLPLQEKYSATVGMAMTEKQGGSDVRAGSTRARRLGAGGEYLLTGHKWFCSAPMSDGFLTLAQTDRGLSCFLVPRWAPDGSRNPFHIQRLKNKLGNRSNASAEIEYRDTWAQLVGEEGRGVNAIIEMVHHTRLDASVAPAAMMRQALVQALHHSAYREAFGERLCRQPLMRNVLADLALESEAATRLVMHVAEAFDGELRASQARPLARLTVAVSKYWLNKRAPAFVCEALECLGGAGYVEESGLPRIYREAPLNGIWEGCGNIICLDVLRTLGREPAAVAALVDWLESHRGLDSRFDTALEELKLHLSITGGAQSQARMLVELMALCLQGALMLRDASAVAAEAFCASRLGGNWGHQYGTLSEAVDFDGLIEGAVRSIPVNVSRGLSGESRTEGLNQ